MADQIEIVPAILSTTEEEYRTKIEDILQSGVFETGWVQIDLMDGKFVQNTSVGPEIVDKYPINLNLEAHLMVKDPHMWVNNLKGAHIRRFIAPIETDSARLDEFISLVRTFSDAEVGFSINPETPVEKLSEYLEVADAILIMSVHPGFGGQDFIPETLDKIKSMARLRGENGLNFLIGVDGGINESNVKSVVAAGADYIVIGSHLIYGDIEQNLEKIWQSLYS